MNFLTYTPTFLEAAWTTIWSATVAFGIGLVLGGLVAVARRSPSGVLGIVATVYIEALRNTPVLVQIFMAYFGLASLGIRLPPLVAGIAALSINAGAYLAEVLRAGLQSVPAGQLEAARTLGLKPAQTFRSIVLPQAMRTVYPPVVNQFIDLILASSLLSAISVNELTSAARIVNSITFETLWIFGFVMVFYLVLTNLVSFGSGALARAVFRPQIKGPYRFGFRGSRLLRTMGGSA